MEPELPEGHHKGELSLSECLMQWILKSEYGRYDV